MSLKAVFISDTHCQLRKVKVPNGDILFHTGDLTYRGNVSEIREELDILANLPHKHKVLICGNHDWLGERNPELMKELCEYHGITYLCHESVEIEGIKIFGSPYTPTFMNWAFNVPVYELESYWESIPEDTNILVTHGPPYLIGDIAPRGGHVGCVALRGRVRQLKKLTHHAFGHIHEGYGTTAEFGVTFINASICTGDYKPTNKPIVVQL